MGIYQVAAGIHTPHITPGDLSKVLEGFTHAAGKLTWLRALTHASSRVLPEHTTGFTSTGGAFATPAAYTLSLSSSQAEPQQGKSAFTDAPMKITAVARALLQGVAAAIDRCLQPVIQTQQQNRFLHMQSTSGQCSASRDTCPLTVLQLQVVLRPVLMRIQTLYDDVRVVMESYTNVFRYYAEKQLEQEALQTKDSGAITARSLMRDGSITSRSNVTRTSQHGHRISGTRSTGLIADHSEPFGHVQARASTALIDALMERVDMIGGPQGQAHQQQALYLLCCAMGPLVSSLQAWMFDGVDDSMTGRTLTSYIIVHKTYPVVLQCIEMYRRLQRW